MVRWRPLTATTKTRHVILSTNASGVVQHWHVTSGKCLHTIREEQENGDTNQVFCLDYHPDASKFATAGQDYKVRLYDEATKTQISTLCGGYGKAMPGHSNRVFSLKFSEKDPNLLVSGGWDNTIQIWDCRQEAPARSCFGAHIAGDSVDVHGDMILSGSWRPHDALQMWDLGSGELMHNINWGPKVDGEATLLYAAQFSQDNARRVIAGGSGTNEARLFDRASGELLGSLREPNMGPVFSVDF